MTKHSKIFAGVASAISFTAGVSAWAAGDQDFSSMQMKGVEQIEVKVDLDGPQNAYQKRCNSQQFPIKIAVILHKMFTRLRQFSWRIQQSLKVSMV